MKPAGILLNTATGRHHPIVFRPAPLPSANLSDKVQRHRSVGHHTEGFDTLKEALHEVGVLGCWDTGLRAEWDGAEVPAMVVHLETSAP